MQWSGKVVYMGDLGSIYIIEVGELEGRGTLGRCKHRWEGA
jgi:hypothetical protein